MLKLSSETDNSNNSKQVFKLTKRTDRAVFGCGGCRGGPGIYHQKLSEEFQQMAAPISCSRAGQGFWDIILYKVCCFTTVRPQTPTRFELTVHDNFIRGVPGWLSALEGILS